MALTKVPTELLAAGAVVQVANFQTGAVATGTTTIPLDDTIPQNTEGTEFMALAFTPESASNKLRIDVVVNCTNNNVTNLTAALFQDSTAGALAVAAAVSGGASYGVNIKLTHWMTAGTVSATTFKVRVGASGASTITFNGAAGARWFGGAMVSSITITEIAA